MSLPKVVFLDRATIPVQIQVPHPSFAHDWVEYDLTSPEQVIERLTDADIVISNKVVLDQAALSQLPNLKMIAVVATGFNNVDINYCAEHNVACRQRAWLCDSLCARTCYRDAVCFAS